MIRQVFILLVATAVLLVGGWFGWQQITQNAASPANQVTQQPDSITPVLADEQLQVLVALPVYLPLMQALGDTVAQVDSVLPIGISAEAYELRPQDLQKISASDLVVLAGGFAVEQQIADQVAAAPGDVAVVTLTDELAALPAAQSLLNPQDPHIWLSPSLLKLQTKILADQLTKLAPNQIVQIQANQQAVVARLTKQRAQLELVLQPCRDKPFLVVHPAFGYFAREFGMTQLSVEPFGRAAGPRDITTAIAEARRLGINTVFAQPQEGQQLASQVASAISGKVGELDDLSPDVIGNYLVIAKRLAAAEAQCSR